MKNKIILMLSLISMTSLNSQELDPSFIDSLPDDIKKDLMEKNAKQGLNAKENYKPYLYSSKLNQAEELIELKERLELDLIELERRLKLDDGLIIDDSLLICIILNSPDVILIFFIIRSDLKNDKKSTYTLMLLTGINKSLYLISGFCVSKNKLNSFGLILNLIVSNFKLIFLISSSSTKSVLFNTINSLFFASLEL